MGKDRPRILIIEDQPGERETLERFLRAENYDVVSAAGSRRALEFMHESFDLVLSDVRVGGESGMDLLKAWKQRHPRTAFILITAFGEIAAAVEAVKAGAEDYLVKPVRPNELLAKISQGLEAGRRKASATAAGTSGNGSSSTLGGEHRLNGSDRVANVPLEEIERAAIERTLQDCSGNRTHAAQALGISVRTLQRKLKAWNAEAAAAGSVGVG
jgi:DNA-binding NtrC family response regulator